MRGYDFIKSPCVIDSKTLGSGVEVTFYRQPKKITALTLAGVYAGDVVAPDQFASAIGDMLVEFSESIVSHNFIGFLLWVGNTTIFKRLEVYFSELTSKIHNTRKVFNNREEFKNWITENEGMEYLVAVIEDSDFELTHGDYSNCSSAVSTILNCSYDKHGNKATDASLLEYTQLLQLSDDRIFETFNDVREFMLEVPQDISDSVLESFVCSTVFKQQFER